MLSDGALAFDRLLAAIGRAGPRPWYPAEYLHATGVDRAELIRALDELRLAGLIQLTPWEQGVGQGLELTAGGAEVLLSSRWLSRLGRGELPSPSDVARHVDGPEDESTTFGRGEAVRRALLNPVTPRVTQVLLGINIAVFLVGVAITMVGPGAGWQRELRALYLTGAVRGDLLLQGQWWRLLSSCFVHIGAMHLFMNMYALWIIGPLQEQLWGRWRFLCIYLVSGFVGSCAAMSLKPDIIVAGASGCIWGLMASQLAWIYLNRAHLPRELVSSWGRRLGSVILVNAIISFLPGISAEGHFGGGAAGVLVAGLLHVHRFVRGPIRWAGLLGVLLVPVMSIGAIQWAKDHTSRWNRVVKFHQVVKQFREQVPVLDGDPE